MTDSDETRSAVPSRGQAVILDGVRKAFGGNVVHDGVTLSVRKGEIMTLVGGSGQGKTVLLKEIMGLACPDSGHVFVHGRDVTCMTDADLQALRTDVAMVFQGSALFDSLSVRDNVAYGLVERNRRMPRDEIDAVVEEKLALVDLPGTEALMPAELSGGMKKRVALARALATDPTIILYDEPTTGLDPANVRRINAIITKLRDDLGVTGIVVTHDMAATKAVTNRLALLDRGRIIGVGTWDEMEGSGNDQIRRFLQGDFGE